MTLAEYNCLCIYNIKVAVYPRPQIMNLSDLGTIYDDCKPTYLIATADHNWQAIQFEKQVLLLLLFMCQFLHLINNSVPEAFGFLKQ